MKKILTMFLVTVIALGSSSIFISATTMPKEVNSAIQLVPGDMDDDGLSDLDEEIYGTNPNDPDTDRDWINDGQEVNVISTNPLVPDINDGGFLTLNVDPQVYNYFNDASIYAGINYWTNGQELTNYVTINLQMRTSVNGENGNTSCNPTARVCTVSISEFETNGSTIKCMEKACERTLTHEFGHVYQSMTTGEMWHNYQPSWSEPDGPHSQACPDDVSDDPVDKKCHIMLPSFNTTYMNDYYFLLDRTQSLPTKPVDPSINT